MGLDHVVAVLEPRQPRVRGREEVIVDREPATVVIQPGTEIGRVLQRHVARRAALLRLGRVIEAPRSMPGHAGEEERIVMVLATEELLVSREFLGEVDFVAGGAELGIAVEVLQKGLLVHRRLRLDELVVDPLEERVLTLRKGVMNRLVDRVVGIPLRAVDVRDRMADGAGDAGVGRRVVDVVVVLVVESAAVERHRIVAAGTPPSRLHAPVPLEGDEPRLANARQVGGVVEAREVVAAPLPARVDVGVALLAVVVHHERVSGDVVAGGSAGQRRLEVLLPLLRSLGIPVTRILGMEEHHQPDRGRHHAGVRQPHSPLDLWAHQPVEPVEPCRHQRCRDVRPVGGLREERRPRPGVCRPQAQQQSPRDEDHQRRHEEGVADADRPAVLSVLRVEHVDDAEDDKRRHEHEPEDEVDEEHPLIEPVLIRLARAPFEERDRGEVGRIGADHGKQAENDVEEDAEPRANRRHMGFSRRARGGRDGVGGHGTRSSS